MYKQLERSKNMNNDKLIKLQINSINEMNVAELKTKFMELYGFETKSCSATVLRNRLIYRVQEIYYGGLSQEDQKFLLKLAEKDHLATMRKARKRKQRVLAGTRLLRSWQGVDYEVVVTDDGQFECEGNLYNSLSAVARAITGTRWNGKIFFGVS
jgi:hypothetical protein